QWPGRTRWICSTAWRKTTLSLGALLLMLGNSVVPDNAGVDFLIGGRRSLRSLWPPAPPLAPGWRSHPALARISSKNRPRDRTWNAGFRAAIICPRTDKRARTVV